MVSVIIPIYNVQVYLDKCLLSVINQTYKNLEIILINDGSTDQSLNICEIYAKKDNRIRIINQANSGVSKARNKGLDLAKGDYIAFVDSDDYLELDMIEKMVNYINKNQVDIICCGYNEVSESGNLLKISTQGNQNGEILTNRQTLDVLFTTEILKGFLFNKLFKRECIDRERLPEDLDICEDFYFFSKLLCKDIKIMYVNDRLYNHVYNLSGATKKVAGLFDENNELKYLISMRRIRSLFNDPEILNYISKKEVRLVLETYVLMLKNKYRDRNKEFRLFKVLSENKKYLFAKKEQLKYKVAYILFYYYYRIRSLGWNKVNE